MALGLAGNERLKNLLADLIRSGRLPHAVIICGGDGCGKHTVAEEITEALGCTGDGEKPCGKCEACRKIRERLCPDVTYISPEKKRKTIGVEAIRTIRENVYIVPNDLDKRIFVIDDASGMTAQAQNALLKLLEEPPENVYFILIASDVTALLSTVRSRAPELRLESFSNADMKKFLTEREEKARELEEKDPELLSGIINSAQGSYGRALKELLGKREENKGKTVKEFLSALAGFGKGGFFGMIGALPVKQREDAEDFADSLLLAFRDLIAVRKSGDAETLFFPSFGEARELAVRFPFDTLVKMYVITETADSELKTTSVNLMTEYLTLMTRLWNAK